ncbi:hypothetical protein PV939_11560, partial [Ligilactobacillus salivarius]|nr:hypothetical protein [Ligilactobacillus salivarius]
FSDTAATEIHHFSLRRALSVLVGDLSSHLLTQGPACGFFFRQKQNCLVRFAYQAYTYPAIY